MPMRTSSTFLAAVLAASLVSGCNKEKTPAASATASSPTSSTEPSADTVVATFGDGQKITFGELNERLKDPLANLEKQKYQTRKQGLDGFVVEKLVKAEADKRKVTEEELVKAEVDEKIPQPPEEEIKKLYDEAKERLPPGTTYEQVKPQIVDFLSGSKKQERAREYFGELKKNANVQITLPEPPRPPVERKEVAATGPAKGPDSAPVTIVEFSDFQCPFCSRAIKTVDEVMKAYPDKVKLVFRQFPLEFHKEAPKAAEAALCAADQNKFWEFHDTLFANQSALQPDKLKEHAKTVGLDTAKFNKCLDSGEKAAAVKTDQEAGQKVGVNGTPAFFINGILLSGAQPFDEFKSVIDAELQAKK
jgi:protein-disulfide isomerase